MWRLSFLFLLSVSVQAKTLVLDQIYIEEKEEWQLSKDLFGMPFVYFTPEVNGQRSNISFTNTGAEVALDVKSLAQTQDEYRENKKKWAQKIGATPESFLPYEVSTNKNGHKIHRIGFNFQHEGKSYSESSFYIECRGKILFSKSMRLKTNEAHDKDFRSLLHTLDCGGV